LEERGHDDERWLGKRCSDATSSEEIDSDDNFMASSISKSSRSLVFENKVWNPAVQPRLHGTSSTGGGAAYHSPSLPDGHPISQGPPSNRKNWRSKEACQESSIEEGEAAEHAEWLAGSPSRTARDISFAE